LRTVPFSTRYCLPPVAMTAYIVKSPKNLSGPKP
jgi:hypothetical protein